MGARRNGSPASKGLWTLPSSMGLVSAFSCMSLYESLQSYIPIPKQKLSHDRKNSDVKSSTSLPSALPLTGKETKTEASLSTCRCAGKLNLAILLFSNSRSSRFEFPLQEVCSRSGYEQGKHSGRSTNTEVNSPFSFLSVWTLVIPMPQFPPL